ncbi:hypothetical protein BaRGS_00014566, partial [Batillaria attramentaria]
IVHDTCTDRTVTSPASGFNILPVAAPSIVTCGVVCDAGCVMARELTKALIPTREQTAMHYIPEFWPLHDEISFGFGSRLTYREPARSIMGQEVDPIVSTLWRIIHFLDEDEKQWTTESHRPERSKLKPMRGKKLKFAGNAVGCLDVVASPERHGTFSWPYQTSTLDPR